VFSGPALLRGRVKLAALPGVSGRQAIVQPTRPPASRA
jgi:hypothetical protein